MTATQNGAESIPATRLLRVPVTAMSVLPDPFTAALGPIAWESLDASTSDLDPPPMTALTRRGEGYEVEEALASTVCCTMFYEPGNESAAAF
jgi:hypothetical protein